jgi:putative ABC transport system permease protein
MFKRAWLSITRKLSKTIILTIIMFVMANLVLSSIAIKNAVKESTDFAKSSLESTVYLNVDMEKIMESARNEATANSTADGRNRMQITRPSISLEMVKKIANSEYVRDYTYQINANAKEENFTALEDSGANTGMFAGGRGVNLNGNISIIGINSYAFINEVKDNSMSLEEGTYFDENTTDKAIISIDLADENDLKVGDKIELTNAEYDMENFDPRRSEEPEAISSETHEIEIIGIYNINTDSFNGNTVYMNVETASKFLKADTYNNGEYGVESVSYFLTSPDNADAFVKEAEKKYPDMSSDNLKLEVNNDSYEKMAGPIEQVGSFSDTVLWIVVVASVLIITLLINNNIKDRKYEMGVLMSLGGTKKNIIGSVLIELIIIATIGFTLSIGTSYFLADNMGKTLLENQIEATEEQSTNNYGRPVNNIGPGGNFQNREGMGGEPVMNNTESSNIETIDSINVKVGIHDYAILFLIGYVVSVIAMIIPAINIVKYEPKTILTGRA